MHPLLNSKNKTLFALNSFIYLQKILYSHYLNRRISMSSYTSTLWKLNFRELYNRLGKALRNSSCKNLVKNPNDIRASSGQKTFLSFLIKWVLERYFLRFYWSVKTINDCGKQFLAKWKLISWLTTHANKKRKSELSWLNS